MSSSVKRKVQPFSVEQEPSTKMWVSFWKVQRDAMKSEVMVVPPRQYNFIKVALNPTSNDLESPSAEPFSWAAPKKESHLWPTPPSRIKFSSEGKMLSEETGSSGGSDLIRKVRR